MVIRIKKFSYGKSAKKPTAVRYSSWWRGQQSRCLNGIPESEEECTVKGVAGRVVGASVPSAQLARSRGRNRKSCEYRRQLLSVNAFVRMRACTDYTTPSVRSLHCSSCTCTIIQLHRRLPALNGNSSSPARPYFQLPSRYRSRLSAYVQSSVRTWHRCRLIHEVQPIQFWKHYGINLFVSKLRNGLRHCWAATLWGLVRELLKPNALLAFLHTVIGIDDVNRIKDTSQRNPTMKLYSQSIRPLCLRRPWIPTTFPLC